MVGLKLGQKLGHFGSLLTRMSLFLTIKKLGLLTDPLPPLSPMSLYILFFLWLPLVWIIC